MIETLTLASLCHAQSPLVLAPDDPVCLAVSVMGERYLSSVVIVAGDLPVGLFTERDALGLIAAGTYRPDTPLRELMSPDLITAPPEMTFADGYARMAGEGVRHLVLTNPTGRLYGVLSETDFAQTLGAEELQGPRTVADLMTREPATVPPGTSIAAALALMAGRRISSVIVAEGDRALGILTERDVIRLATVDLDLHTTAVAAAMSQPLLTIHPEAFAYEATPRMFAAGVRHLVVADSAGRLVGILGRSNLLRDIHDVHLCLLRRTIAQQGQALRDARQQLREQGLLRSMFEASPAGISLRALDGRLVLVNPALLAMLGYQDEPQSVIGRHFSEFVVATDRAQETRLFARLQAGELASYRLEKHYHHRDGHTVVAEVTVTAIRDTAGTLTHTLAMVNDLTELRLWAGAFQHCAHGIALGSPQTNTIRACNPAFAALMGAAPAAIAGQPISSVYAPADLDLLRQHIAIADRTGRTRYEARMRRRDASSFDVQMDLVSVFAPDGSVQYRVATMQDISARKRAQAALQESEERYRGIVNNVMDSIFILDLQGHFLAVNDQACRRYGYDRETFLTLHIGAIDTPEDAVNVQERLAVLNQTGSATFEAVHQDAQGHPILVEVRATKTLFDGKPCLLSVVRDISERKQAELALRESEERLRLFIEYAPAALGMLDRDLRHIAVSRRWLDNLGLESEDLLGRLHYDVFPHLPERWKEAHRRGLAGEVVRNDDDCFELHDGSRRWVRWEIRPWHAADGTVAGIVIFSEDITEWRQVQQSLRESEARYRLLYNNIADPIIMLDRQGQVLAVNDRACQHYGYPRELFLTRHINDIRAPEKAVDAPDRIALEDQQGEAVYETLHRDAGGRVIPVEVRATRIMLDGQPAILCLCHDITERQQAEETIKRSRADLERAQAIAHVGSWSMDLVTNQIEWSRENYRIFGIEHGTPISYDTFFSYVHPEDRAGIEAFIRQAIARASIDGHKFRVMVAGEVKWIHSITKCKVDGNGTLRSLFGTNQDITEQTLARQQIEYLAYHDDLTGLPNRVQGQSRLQQAIASASRLGRDLAVLHLDLNQFKYVNDTHGHRVGDQLLQAVAGRLSQVVGTDDILCRLSGDEFMLVLPQVASPGFAPIADVCDRVRAAFANPFVLDDRRLFLSLSIGVARYPQDGADAETLMRHANTALFEAKRAGQDSDRFFTPSMNADLMRFVQTRDRLRVALEQGEFALYYQPQIDLHSRRVVGVEALIRWHRPEEGLILPEDFIAVAEQSGLIVPLSQWVLQEACRQAAAWCDRGWTDLVVAVNLSAVHFRQGQVEQDVLAALEASGLNPVNLELELTESLLLDQPEGVIATLARWKARGLRMSIDDFGTGYSSLAYLKRFKVDKLKIDRSFIAHLQTDADDYTIVQAIIQIARSMNLKTIAEGVEHAALADQLKFIGCDEVQGYLYSKPLPAAELEPWLSAYAEWSRRVP